MSVNNVSAFGLSGGSRVAVDTTAAGGYFRFEATDVALTLTGSARSPATSPSRRRPTRTAPRSCASRRATSRSRSTAGRHADPLADERLRQPAAPHRRARGRLQRHRRGQPAGRLARRNAAPADQHDVGRGRPEVRRRRRRDAARAAGGPVPPLRGDRRHAERPRPDAERRRDVHEVRLATSRSSIANAELSLGGGVVTVTGASATLTIDSTGLAGTFSRRRRLRGSGRAVLRQPHRRRRHARRRRATCASRATGVDITIAGQSLHGRLHARAGPERGGRAGRQDRRRRASRSRSAPSSTSPTARARSSSRRAASRAASRSTAHALAAGRHAERRHVQARDQHHRLPT